MNQYLASILNALKRFGRFAKKYRADICYYGVLLAALLALGTAAQRYRVDQDAPPVVDEVSGIAYEPQTFAEPTVQPTPVPPQRPVAGEIVGAFAPDELVWSETLLQWQTHPAVDFAAAEGEAVLAVADGTVTALYTDRLYGNTILIDHGDGLTVRYASLNTLELVNEGDRVVRGEVISAAGRCAAEDALGAHVHIEAYQNGEAIPLF